MDNQESDYEKVKALSKNISTLHGVLSLLRWDQETAMPEQAVNIRGDQFQELAAILHKKCIGDEYVSALSKLVDLSSGEIKDAKLNDDQRIDAKLWRRELNKKIVLPTSFVEEMAKLTTTSQLVWRQARMQDDFALFAPFLEKIIAMCRQKAEYLGYKDHPYDALIDLYEPEMSTKQVEELFSNIKKPLSKLIHDVCAKQQVNDANFHGAFSIDLQEKLSKQLLKDIGFDFKRGLLTKSAHPFCSSFHPTDCRITTRYDESYVLSNIRSVMHEAGHALYEMGLPIEHFGTPLGESVSLGLHESQSRWWETRIGQSLPFWKWFLPILKKHFPGKFDDLSSEQAYKAANKVERSFIRVEADELTYPMHVILRFELEKRLIEGSLSVKDLPDAWNSGMQELLEITPTNYREGCLQDVHWAIASFGYFPTYTLGNMYAAQLFETYEKEQPQWKQQIESGAFNGSLDWLRHNIHRHGRRYSSHELVKNVSGKDFTSQSYMTYLEQKYKEIYSAP